MRWIGFTMCMLCGCVLTAGCGVEGIHSANPTTILRVKPAQHQIEFLDNKDNDLTLKKLTYNPETKEVMIDDLKIINNSSTVRESNVGQINALAIQAESIGKAWSMGINAGANLMAQAVPWLGRGTGNAPIWGEGQLGATPPGWIYVGPPTTTQPND